MNLTLRFPSLPERASERTRPAFSCPEKTRRGKKRAHRARSLKAALMRFSNSCFSELAAIPERRGEHIRSVFLNVSTQRSGSSVSRLVSPITWAENRQAVTRRRSQHRSACAVSRCSDAACRTRTGVKYRLSAARSARRRSSGYFLLFGSGVFL